MVVPEQVGRFAYRKGLFVLAQSGNAIEIRNDSRFLSAGTALHWSLPQPDEPARLSSAIHERHEPALAPDSMSFALKPESPE